MEGPDLLRYHAWLLLAVGLPLGACAEFQPEPDSMPVAMYDSPLIANGIPEDSSADGEKTPAERQKTHDEPRTAEADDESTDRVASPSDARRATPAAAPPTSDDGTTDSAPDEPSAPALATRSDTHAPDEEIQPVSTDDDTESAPTPSREEETGSADAERAASTSSSDRAETTGGGADRPTTEQTDAARYAAAIYELNGVPFPDGARTDIAEMYRHCRDNDAVFQSRAPKAGDLVFFHNVRDANDDGRNNDWYTWVGLVERVENTGTVHLLGYRDGAVGSLTMNRNRPDVHTDGGDVLNTRLREKRSADPPFTQYLAGQLFAGYCSMLGDRSELLVVDNWQPGMELTPPNR